MAQKQNELSESEKMIQVMQNRERLMRTNNVSLAGLVMEIKALPQTPKTDKQGNPVLDENNHPTFYDDKFWCPIGVIGSEEGVLLSAEQVVNLEEGMPYLFEGVLKNRKFQVKTITAI